MTCSCVFIISFEQISHCSGFLLLGLEKENARWVVSKTAKLLVYLGFCTLFLDFLQIFSNLSNYTS